MHLHFACSPGQQHAKVLSEAGAENTLYSYAFIKKPERLAQLVHEKGFKRIILDSGAFSVWARGETIDIEAYAAFAKEFKALIDPQIKLFVVNLDVLPGKWGEVPDADMIAKSAEAGWANMLYLESLGLTVIHVYHQHENISVLDRLKNHSDYIGISPANDLDIQAKLAWMDTCFKYLETDIKKGLRTHGFAVTSHSQLYRYPFYSVDSSSWVAAARFGRLAIFNDRHELKTFAYKKVADVEKYWKYVSYLGMDKISDVSWHDRTINSILTYKKLEKTATELWRRRGIVWSD